MAFFVFAGSDLGIILLMVLIFGASIPVAAANWMLENIALIAFILLVKSLFFIGRGFLAQNQTPAYHLTVFLTLALDIIRSGIFLYIGVDMLSSLFQHGIFGMILGFFELLISGTFATAIAEGPAIVVYQCWYGAPKQKTPCPSLGPMFGLCCGLETLSIALLYLIYIA